MSRKVGYCCRCGGSTSATVQRTTNNGKPYTTWLCDSCAARHDGPRRDRDTLERFKEFG